MYSMNPERTIAFAKELTIKALENGLIENSGTTESKAQKILDFYHKILNGINQND